MDPLHVFGDMPNVLQSHASVHAIEQGIGFGTQVFKCLRAISNGNACLFGQLVEQAQIGGGGASDNE